MRSLASHEIPVASPAGNSLPVASVSGIGPGHLRRNAMKCQRCHGLMLPVFLHDSQMGDFAEAFQCVNCADILDPIILQNRAHQHRQQVADAQFEQVA